jgi:hypothetical protein
MTNQEAMWLLAIIVQTGALFYWGGSVRQMLKDHERRISKLEP